MEQIIFDEHSSIAGINKYELLQTVSEDAKQTYIDVCERAEGSLTTVSDNDAVDKINVAINILDPSASQVAQLESLKDAFKYIENNIDPEKLTFTVSNGTDGEILIYRNPLKGLSQIIIHTDGLIAYSFISYSRTPNSDDLIFFEDVIDFESLAYRFFA